MPVKHITFFNYIDITARLSYPCLSQSFYKNIFAIGDAIAYHYA